MWDDIGIKTKINKMPYASLNPMYVKRTINPNPPKDGV